MRGPAKWLAATRSTRVSRQYATAVLMACVPAAWLIPQHYLPWLAAHQDVAVLSLLALAGLVAPQPRLPVGAWGWAIAIALLSVSMQAATGRIHFRADALMVALYLLAFGGSVGLGQSLASGADLHRCTAPFVWAVLCAAVLSVAVGLMQLTETEGIPLPVAVLLPGDRPYGNFAQANQFSSAVFLGLCALLWLRETGRLGAGTFWLVCACLLLGIAMSGSRTGLLQVAGLSVVAAFQRRASFTPVVRLRQTILMVAALALLHFGWSSLLESARLSGGRSVADAASAGVRPQIWAMAVDAVHQHPWAGYGWQQIPAAQAAVALQHLELKRYFDHAHNLVLDFWLWAGVPMGTAIVAAAAWGLWQQRPSVVSPPKRWLFAAIGGISIHAMLEYPLAYAYMLVPFGLLIGLSSVERAERAIPAWETRTVRLAYAGFASALVVVAADYLRVEQDYRAVRIESAFGPRQITTEIPSLVVLDHLQAYLRFIRTPARAGMSATELNAFEAVARRYAHPPVLLRLALAQGLNSQPVLAAATLRRLCAMHTPDRCAEGIEAWRLLQVQYPILKAVAGPLPPSSPGPADAKAQPPQDEPGSQSSVYSPKP